MGDSFERMRWANRRPAPETALCERLMRFFYSVELQRPETREELRRAWSEILGRTRTPDGLAHFEFPLACVAVRRA